MKEVKIVTLIEVYGKDELDETYSRLYEAAFHAAENAYAPYSNFWVGAAALLENGEVVTGNNQENAAYPSGICAERTALFYAGARYPDSPVKALAIAAIKEGRRLESITPCGACRQVMLETERRYGKPMCVMMCGSDEVRVLYSAGALLPFCFDHTSL